MTDGKKRTRSHNNRTPGRVLNRNGTYFAWRQLGALHHKYGGMRDLYARTESTHAHTRKSKTCTRIHAHAHINTPARRCRPVVQAVRRLWQTGSSSKPVTKWCVNDSTEMQRQMRVDVTFVMPGLTAINPRTHPQRTHAAHTGIHTPSITAMQAPV